MTDRRELEQRNDAIHAEHRAAVARGEERVLRTTRTGLLHSYRPDEIGLGPATTTQATSWWGLSIMTAFFVALFAASWLIILLPAHRGGSPAWAGLWVTALSGPLAVYTAGLARMQLRARRTRRRRGAPEPSDAPVPYRWSDPAPEPRPRAPHPRADRWRKRPWWWVIARGLLAGFLVLATIGTLLEPDSGTASVLVTSGVGLALSVALPVALASRRVRNAGV